MPTELEKQVNVKKSAKDIIPAIKRSKERLDKELDAEYLNEKLASEKALEKKCVEAVNLMIKEGNFSTEVELTETLLLGVPYVTEEMRKLDYKFCLIQVQDTNNVVISHRLRISVKHLL